MYILVYPTVVKHVIKADRNQGHIEPPKVARCTLAETLADNTSRLVALLTANTVFKFKIA